MTEQISNPSQISHLDGDGLTPLRPGVREAIMQNLSELANPTARYSIGRRANHSLEACREEIARMIGASPSEILFTSSASESNTWAIMGASLGTNRPFSKLLVGSTDHISVINAMNARSLKDHIHLEKILPQSWTEDLSSHPSLASFTWADAEVGRLSPIKSIGNDVKASGGIIHIDFVAAQRTERINVHHLPVDMLTLSSASMGGPPGIAALYVRKGVRINPLIFGGSQEDGRRGGSIPVFLAEGWKTAIRHWDTHVEEEREKILEFTRSMQSWFHKTLPFGVMPITNEPSLPGILNMLIPGIDGQAAISKLDAKGIQSGTGSSCSAQSLKVSHVLRAMGVSSLLGQGSVVVTLPWNSTQSDIEHFQQIFPSVLEELFALSPKNLVSPREE